MQATKPETIDRVALRVYNMKRHFEIRQMLKDLMREVKEETIEQYAAKHGLKIVH